MGRQLCFRNHITRYAMTKEDTPAVPQPQGLDAMVDVIAHRVAKIVMEQIVVYLNPKEELVTKKQAMEMLNVSETTLWRWERMGLLSKSGTFGRRVYYKLDDIKRALDLTKTTENNS